MEKNFLLGLDVGGTKCACILGAAVSGGGIEILDKVKFPTAEAGTPRQCLERMAELGLELCSRHGVAHERLRGCGVSCGGPLDSRRGVIQSPPNLPGWDEVPAVDILGGRLGIPVRLQNDANAGAVAEWKFGAGRGVRNMVFLTFGTGLGAGLILDGRLYSGIGDSAGECGHIRLAPFGPVGFGKAGSFEGFCSGGGIAQLAAVRVREQLQLGNRVAWCPSPEAIPGLNAKIVGDAAGAGDPLALAVYAECGAYLGRGLAVLIDLLNPELIVIGSVFARSESLLRPAMERSIAEEALPGAAVRCRVVLAALGEAIGDYAALALALGEY